MHHELKECQEKIYQHMKAKIEACGLDEISDDEMGDFTDMMKDLSEARYYDAIVDAMGIPEPEEARRMGYDNWRYASGRFAPEGRGSYRPGYTMMMDEPRDFPGYTDGRGYDMGRSERSTGVAARANGRMGYVDTSNPYGRSYSEYQDRKRSYTENQSAENRRMMEDSADKHIDETVDTFREIWADVDQPMKIKMRDKLTRLVNEMA